MVINIVEFKNIAQENYIMKINRWFDYVPGHINGNIIQGILTEGIGRESGANCLIANDKNFKKEWLTETKAPQRQVYLG